MDKETLKKMADPDDFSWVSIKAWPNERVTDGHWFDKLMNHHMEETAFLRSTIAELAKELLKVYDKKEKAGLTVSLPKSDNDLPDGEFQKKYNGPF